MLAPMIIGMAIWTFKPAPMAATMIELKVDELCTRTVPKIPIINPITGFVNSLPLNMSPEIGKNNLIGILVTLSNIFFHK